MRTARMRCPALLVLILVSVGNCFQEFEKRPPPVVFVPGDGASIIEGHVNKTAVAAGCQVYDGWFRLWLNLKLLMPGNLPCTVNYWRMMFDANTNTSHTIPGVETRVPGFGTAYAIEYMDPSWAAYFMGNVGADAHALVEELLQHGYVRDTSITGAPYDFRLTMASQKLYFRKLRLLVEWTYKQNGNLKVALIGHSLGGLYTTWFLNHQSQSWKDKFIDCFISVSTPWGGSIEALQSIVSGFNFRQSEIDSFVVRKAQQTFESNYLLLPNPNVWPKATAFVATDERNYTASRADITHLVEKLQMSPDMYHYVLDTNAKWRRGVMPPHPGVTTFCLYGAEITTGHALYYSGHDLIHDQPILSNTIGDGSVGHLSLSACREWDLKDRQIELKGIGHVQMIQHKKAIDLITKILFRNISR
ncbi:unnamed protein product [Clavelina lepadiformis]|uniref:Uncharacterized protein n=1 Tax=Clavelina lepadiformis TaxID=159417 RepID=A0ABP0FET6_CLALP